MCGLDCLDLLSSIVQITCKKLALMYMELCQYCLLQMVIEGTTVLLNGENLQRTKFGVVLLAQ